MSTDPNPIVTKDARDRAAADARDKLVFAERREREIEHAAKTARLRAMRLAQETSKTQQASAE